MWALVESGTISKMFNYPKAITIGDIQHPSSIFTIWSEAELNAIGIHHVVEDEDNKKDEEYYENTGITYTFNAGTGKVEGVYGTATAKNLAELKTFKKQILDEQCNSILSSSDWMAVKAFEESGDVESGWKTWRASVRTKCNSMQTQIDGASDVAALKALFTYSGEPLERPLGQFPVKE